jgi:hypothetical protein
VTANLNPHHPSRNLTLPPNSRLVVTLNHTPPLSPTRARAIQSAAMASKGVSTLKFVGTVSLGLLTVSLPSSPATRAGIGGCEAGRWLGAA